MIASGQMQFRDGFASIAAAFSIVDRLTEKAHKLHRANRNDHGRAGSDPLARAERGDFRLGQLQGIVQPGQGNGVQVK